MRKIIEIPVGDLMSAPALTVKPETTIDELTRLFAEHEFNGLPVVNDLRVLSASSPSWISSSSTSCPILDSSPSWRTPGSPRSAPS